MLTQITAHQQYGIERVVIFDIDLHHGNGTQEIAWRLNALAHKTLLARQKPPSPRKGSPKKTASPLEVLSPVLQVFYGSVHDIDSYRKLA
jgi:histone deacetylase HOS3